MKNKKVLTVYYSHLGHTAIVAKEVKAAAGGDIARIEMQKPYTEKYFAALIPGGFDILTGKKPALKEKIDISSYDIIFVGGPVWFMTVPAPVLSFLSGNDFNGKTVVPFCTEGGKSSGKFFKTLAKNVKGAKVLDGIDISGDEFKKPAEISQKVKNRVAQTENLV